jgi:hypothetical protein
VLASEFSAHGPGVKVQGLKLMVIVRFTIKVLRLVLRVMWLRVYGLGFRV